MQNADFISLLFGIFHSSHLISQVIVLAIISVFAFAMFYLIGSYLRIKKEYLAAMNSLSQFERNSGGLPENLQKINDIFKPLPRLQHLWIEYSESLVKEKINEEESQFRSTKDAEQFFNSHSLTNGARNGTFHTGVYSAVPNFLTGLGIIGTFFGILIGVPESHDIAGIADKLPNFLSGMKGAFLASVTGLILALIFNFFEKNFLDNIETCTKLLADQIDKIFLRKTEQEYLSQISILADKQLAALRGLANEFGTAVVSGITGSGVQSVQLDDAVKEGVARGFAQLAKTLIHFQEFQSNYLSSLSKAQEVQNKLLDTFLSINESSAKCNQSLQSTTLSFNDSAQVITTAASSWKKAVEQTQSVMDAQKTVSSNLEVAVEKSQSLATSVLNAQPVALREINLVIENFKSVNNKFSDQAAEYHGQITKGLENNLSAFDKELGNAVNKLGSGISSLSTFMLDLTTKIEEINNVLTKAKEEKIKDAA